MEQLTDEEHRLKDQCARRSWVMIPYRIKDPLRVVTTQAGEIELAAPRVEKPGRVYCVNPLCGHSSAQERFPGCTEIICGPCFKKAPDLRREYRALWALRRKQERRRLKRHGATDQASLSELGLHRRQERNWQRIIDYFTQPERPDGLEQFLKEIGFDEDDRAQEREDHDR